MAEPPDQREFAWTEIDDRFPLGMCLTLVPSTEIAAVLDEYHTVQPRGTPMPADANELPCTI